MLKKKLMGILLIFLSILLQNCSGNWETFEEGQYLGTAYKLQTRSRHGLFASTNSVDYRLKLGNLPFISIDALTTDWGPVYSTAIFGNDPYLYITSQDTAYSNHIDSINRTRSFLYLRPDNFSKTDFAGYAAFLKSGEWERVDRKHALKDGTSRFPFPHIIGIVYGKPEKYHMNFEGDLNGEKMILRIQNDGRIQLTDKGEAGFLSSGISANVQMPGKIIYSDTSAGGLAGSLEKFVNKKAETPLRHFNFLIKP